jgi:phosphatidate cytidylyltransferase
VMLKERLIVVIFIVIFGVGFIAIGGWSFTLLVAIILGVAAWEYGRIFRRVGREPATGLIVVMVVVLTFARFLLGFQYSDLILAFSIMAAMGWYIIRYQGGLDSAATDYTITLTGIFYIGWLGSYLVSLRNLPNGLWWFMLAIPAIGMADAGAFFFGVRFGKHKMAPRVSPKKSWEGYFGGVVVGTLGGALFGLLWSLRAPAITPLAGLALGFIVSVLGPFGDLGESLLKREIGVKDTSNLLPGHGGFLDRIDSWLWTGAIAYYLISFWLG